MGQRGRERTNLRLFEAQVQGDGGMTGQRVDELPIGGTDGG